MVDGGRVEEAVKLLKLTNEKSAKVDDEDYDRCNRYTWCDTGKGIVRTDNGTHANLKLSVFILNYQGNLTIDHKDRDYFNNQKLNLREANKTQQSRNRGKFNDLYSSEFKGVSYSKQSPRRPWKVGIKANGKQLHLGYFVDEIEAAKVYNEYAMKYFGEFAVLNDV